MLRMKKKHSQSRMEFESLKEDGLIDLQEIEINQDPAGVKTVLTVQSSQGNDYEI
tara:strand:+ start:298 stop:462 length:165 start_codon:yes stop_codon:yes gene_type:complete